MATIFSSFTINSRVGKFFFVQAIIMKKRWYGRAEDGPAN